MPRPGREISTLKNLVEPIRVAVYTLKLVVLGERLHSPVRETSMKARKRPTSGTVYPQVQSVP